MLLTVTLLTYPFLVCDCDERNDVLARTQAVVVIENKETTIATRGTNNSVSSQLVLGLKNIDGAPGSLTLQQQIHTLSPR